MKQLQPRQMTLLTAADTSERTELDEVAVLQEKLMDSSTSAEEVCQSNVLNRIRDCLKSQAESV